MKMNPGVEGPQGMRGLPRPNEAGRGWRAGTLMLLCLLGMMARAQAADDTVRWWQVGSANGLNVVQCQPQAQGPGGLAGYVTTCRNAYFHHRESAESVSPLGAP
jgi:hypothetical protein